MLMTRQGCVALGFLLVLLFVAQTKVGAEPQDPPSSTATSPPEQTSAPMVGQPDSLVIPMADISMQAAQVSDLLRTFEEYLAPGAQLDAIINSFSESTAQIESDLNKSMSVLDGQLVLTKLQAQGQLWQQWQSKYTGWLKVFSKRSTQLQMKLTELDDLDKVWAETLVSAQNSEAPEPIIQQISATIDSIRGLRTSVKNQLDLVLDLQSRVGGELEKFTPVLAKIARMQQSSVSNILVRNSLPVWSVGFWGDAKTILVRQFRHAGGAYLEDIGNYFKVSLGHMSFHATLFVVSAFLFLRARWRIRRWTTAHEVISPFVKVFEYPLAAALIVVLLVASAPYRSPLPATMRATIQVLALLPTILLIRPSAPGRLVPGLYLLVLLFMLDTFREIFFPEQPIGQIFLMVESFIGMAVTLWFLGKFRSDQVADSKLSGFPLICLRSVLVLVLLLLASGLVAAVTGHMRFARVIIPGILALGMVAILMYVALQVVMGFIAFSFLVWPLRLLQVIQQHRKPVEKYFYRLLFWLAIFGIIGRFLNYIGLLELVLNLARTVLNTKLERGALSISIANIGEFLLTVWVTYFLSSLIRFLLREDVYPRMRIAEGKSYAISRLLHYLILALGFTVAIAALGVDLTKLTVLTGALGIGIGFGLQGVVNNFVSGLILLFERPIQVGDTVAVGELVGQVSKIGIRASTVHTRQGSDIIVPNAELITEKVTNWTFSNQLRRIDLPVGVSYSSSPDSMIALLESVAHEHPHILPHPKPTGLFVGFGDSSLNFELRAWTDQFDDWPIVRSQLASAVYDAVHKAGMKFPFPQREVRLLHDFPGDDPAIS
ncbi:mechanosensitive ion channel family protein [Desulfocastanea catecholica]